MTGPYHHPHSTALFVKEPAFYRQTMTGVRKRVSLAILIPGKIRPTAQVGLLFSSVVYFLTGLDALSKQSVTKNPRCW